MFPIKSKTLPRQYLAAGRTMELPTDTFSMKSRKLQRTYWNRKAVYGRPKPWLSSMVHITPQTSADDCEDTHFLIKPSIAT